MMNENKPTPRVRHVDFIAVLMVRTYSIRRNVGETSNSMRELFYIKEDT